LIDKVSTIANNIDAIPVNNARQCWHNKVFGRWERLREIAVNVGTQVCTHAVDNVWQWHCVQH